MPLSKDFQDILDRMIKQYGDEKGKSVFYAWLNKHKYDDTKPFPKGESLEMSLREFAKMLNPMKVYGEAIHPGMSRNRNLYLPEELEKFAPSLIGRPIYLEHVSSGNAVGKILKSWYDAVSGSVKYDGEIYDESTAEQLRLGLIKNVSICADYDTCDMEEVKIPHNLEADHLGLVAVPGDKYANIFIKESVDGHRVIEATIQIEASKPAFPTLEKTMWAQPIYPTQLCKPKQTMKKAIVPKSSQHMPYKRKEHDSLFNNQRISSLLSVNRYGEFVEANPPAQVIFPTPLTFKENRTPISRNMLLNRKIKRRPAYERSQERNSQRKLQLQAAKREN